MGFVRAGAVASLAVLAAACGSSRSVEQSAVASDCTRCHGYPPPPFATIGTYHPQGASDCHACHPGTVEPDDFTIVPGGFHMDGIVEVVGPAHPMPFVADHTSAALADIASCQACHGADYDGPSATSSCNACHAAITKSAPDWKTNCTFCHGTRAADATSVSTLAAPPVAADRSTNPAKVGAHQAHLVGTALRAALPCTTCHTVPGTSEALTHFTGGTAAIAFDALASKGVASPAYSGGTCAVYCHGSGSQGSSATDAWPVGSLGSNPTPPWSSTGLACDACHASRPHTPGNEAGKGSHFSAVHASAPCASCHAGYVQDTSVDLAIHADGKRTVRFPARDPSQATAPVITLESPGWANCLICHDSGPNGNANAPGF